MSWCSMLLIICFFVFFFFFYFPVYFHYYGLGWLLTLHIHIMWRVCSFSADAFRQWSIHTRIPMLIRERKLCINSGIASSINQICKNHKINPIMHVTYLAIIRMLCIKSWCVLYIRCICHSLTWRLTENIIICVIVGVCLPLTLIISSWRNGNINVSWSNDTQKLHFHWIVSISTFFFKH